MVGSRPELRSGSTVLVDLGVPSGHEAGFSRPVVVVTAQETLDAGPSVVQVVPITTTDRGYRTDVPVVPGSSGLRMSSHAQCQHIRSLSVGRITQVIGRVSPLELRQIREILGLLLDAPPA